MTTKFARKIAARRQSRGQGMTEYIIIVALIAVAAIGAFGYFGKTIQSSMGGLASALSGDTAGKATAKKDAQDSSKAALAEGTTANDMSNYLDRKGAGN